MKGSKGTRRRTRTLRLSPREKSRVSIRSYLQKLDEGSTVAIKINPRYQSIPHPRFNGRAGKVVGSQGRAYFIEVRDGSKLKKVLVNPEHIKPISNQKP